MGLVYLSNKEKEKNIAKSVARVTVFCLNMPPQSSLVSPHDDTANILIDII